MANAPVAGCNHCYQYYTISKISSTHEA